MKHQHKEAFCLMTYACQGRYDYSGTGRSGSGEVPRTRGCGHREIFWNSRDGVTPFITGCPSCGGDLMHVNFLSDIYAPDHKPHHGQAIWRNGTKEEAVAIVKRRRDLAKERGVHSEMLRDLNNYVIRVEHDLEPDWTRPWPMLARHKEH